MQIRENRSCGCMSNNDNYMEMSSCNCPCQNENTVDCELRREMIQEIRCLDFAITELALYLDTHPEDEKALCLHRKYTKQARDLKDKYLKEAPSSPSGPPYCVIINPASFGSVHFIFIGYCNVLL